MNTCWSKKVRDSRGTIRGSPGIPGDPPGIPRGSQGSPGPNLVQISRSRFSKNVCPLGQRYRPANATARPTLPTAWARAGARPWRTCDAAGRQALAIRLGAQGRGKFERVWRARARQCPREPDVLVLAAQEEVLEAVPTGWMPEADPKLDETIEGLRASASRSVALLDVAIEEAHLRGDRARCSSSSRCNPTRCW